MLIQANSLHLPIRDNSIQCCVTSPPYWALRDYGVEGQLGLEKTPDEYIANMVLVFREVHRVLKDDGTLWLNIGDSYAQGGKRQTKAEMDHGEGLRIERQHFRNDADGVFARPSGWGKRGDRAAKTATDGLKPKDLVGIPWMLAFALRADGWYLRQDIIWHKPNPMPESVKDRCTKAHEYVFLLTKNQRYYWDQDAVKEKADTKPHKPGNKALAGGKNDSGHLDEREWSADGFRNLRSVWTIPTQPTPEAHFATFPQKLVTPCILAGSRINDTILDPFVGAGTVPIVAHQLHRQSIGIDLSPTYLHTIANPKIKANTAQTSIFSAIQHAKAEISGVL